MHFQITALLLSAFNTPLTIPAVFSGTLVCANLMMPATQQVRVRSVRYRIKRFLSNEHSAFFYALESAFPHYRILPNVSVAAVIENVRQHQGWRGRADQTTQGKFDFAIYSRDFELVCLVQLDDGDDFELDDLLSELKQLPTLRFSKSYLPTNEELRCAVYLAAIDMSRTFRI